MSGQDYTRQEMMAIATGREIRDGELAIFGVGLAMLAGGDHHHAWHSAAAS
jgi:glutaconate CoA-transferase subunit B